MMLIDKGTIEFVSGKMDISFQEAEDILTVNDKELDITITSATSDSRPKYQLEHDLRPENIDVKKIAASLKLPEKEFSTWVEDDMVWVLYGPNIAEGTAGEGPTPQFATASFYQRWFEDHIK